MQSLPPTTMWTNHLILLCHKSYRGIAELLPDLLLKLLLLSLMRSYALEVTERLLQHGLRPALNPNRLFNGLEVIILPFSRKSPG